MADRFQVYLDDTMQTWLSDRAERHAAPGSVPQRARTELDLWRHHLAAELRATAWTLGEIGCLADVMNGALINDAIGSLIWTELADAFASAPGAWADKWAIDEPELIEKARRLGPVGSHALADAIAQWWVSDGDHTVQGWQQVGVRVAP